MHFSKEKVEILSVLLFKNNRGRTVRIRYYLSKVEIKDYSFEIHGQNVFDQTLKNCKITYKNIRQIRKDHGTVYLIIHTSKKTTSVLQ